MAVLPTQSSPSVREPVFLARQPIFDRGGRVRGYEMLFRDGIESTLLGKTDRLADRQVLELSTMCGHGMISFTFARKMIDWVREGRRTPEQACGYMSRFCSCGIYNSTRAKEILEEARLHNS